MVEVHKLVELSCAFLVDYGDSPQSLMPGFNFCLDP